MHRVALFYHIATVAFVGFASFFRDIYESSCSQRVVFVHIVVVEQHLHIRLVQGTCHLMQIGISFEAVALSAVVGCLGIQLIIIVITIALCRILIGIRSIVVGVRAARRQ